MITGMANTQSTRATLIGEMGRCIFDFHLTGSQFFGGARSDSDWDFYVQDSDDVKRWLDKKGFFRVPAMDKDIPGSYQDTNTVDVFRHECGIDIQVQEDVRIKMIAHEIIDANALKDAKLKRYDHLHIRALWDIAIDKAKRINNLVADWS